MVSQLLLIEAGRSIEMSSVILESNSGSYEVAISTDIQVDLSQYDFILADSFFRTTLPKGGDNYFYTSANESNKNLKEIEKICEAMQSSSLIRSSRVLAIGGGFVQDIATMAASIYMRGLEWHYLPTTLTAMADSCIGGKSSLNLSDSKNQLGNIYPPTKVLIDTRHVESLTIEDKISGLFEAVKICYAKGTESFLDYLKIPAATDPTPGQDLENLVTLSLESKKWFVEKDEFDRKERQLLNFGHSFGHAIESATGFELRHGLAVGVGMLAAINHHKSIDSEMSQALRAYVLERLTPIRSRLKAVIRDFDWDVFQLTLSRDKKNTKTAIGHILIGENGKLVKVMVEGKDDAIGMAIDALKATYNDLIV
jgi:3-dehydroquinate synthase